jgi:T6SS, Phospholipase effector Tle1-like, catalytic domain
MALYAFDGTWNSTKEGDDPAYQNTNVVRFYEAYKNNSGTHDFYVAGVGTRFDVAGRVAGGVFGLGELPRIDEAYDHLCQQWAAGDRVIDIVGFSRGAATTLDFCHRIQEDGIRRPGTDETIEAKPQIRFLGVWDVVAAFGLAILGNVDINIGHHLELPTSSLEYCFHALALDERRLSFLPTRLEGACEVWFRGVHSDIGGGNGNRGLNDITLKWMMSKAKGAGLPITDADIASLKPVPTTLPNDDHKIPVPVRVIGALDRRHYSVSPLTGYAIPPDTCPVETAVDEQKAIELDAAVEVLPVDALRRIAVLWATAQAAAKQQDFPITGVKDALLTLIQGRIPLVTNEDQLTKARGSVVLLVNTMIHGARERGFHVLNEFFLTEARNHLRHLFPFTDD